MPAPRSGPKTLRRVQTAYATRRVPPEVIEIKTAKGERWLPITEWAG